MSRSQYESNGSSSVPSIYSTYICREPVGDVALLINNGPDEYTSLLRTLQRSADHWAEKDHTRTVERLQLEIARLHMRNKQWQRGMRTLVPLWQALTWRQAGWWSILEEVDWALKECAINVRDAEILVGVEWELMNRSLTKRQDSRVHFREALKGLEGTQARPMPAIKSENILSCVTAAFAFADPEGSVGVSLESQLILASRAHVNSAPIKLSQIKITFKGGLRNINIHHDSVSTDQELPSGPIHIQETSLQSTPAPGNVTPESPALGPSHPLSASANLCLRPGQTVVLAFTSIPREAGQVEVSSVTTYITEEDFDLELIFSEDRQLRTNSFWGQNVLGIDQNPLKAERSTAVKILPKPPKMQISLPSLLPIYYVGEDIIIDLEILNEEEEPTKGTVDVRLLGPPEIHPNLAWLSELELSNPLEEPLLESVIENGHQRLPTKQINIMEPGAQQKYGIRVRSSGTAIEYSLQIEAHYCLLSDPETPISKIFSTDLVFIQPFEAAFTFDPRLHPDIWPNYFDIDDTDEGLRTDGGPLATGLTQRWALSSRLTSLATDNLIIEDVSPRLQRIDPPKTAKCNIFSTTASTAESGISSQNNTAIAPGAVRSHTHTIDMQMLDLDDRHAISLDLQLQLRYHRTDPSIPSSTATSPSITTTLHIPSLDLNFRPRCLASLGFSKFLSKSTITSRIIPLIYTIENSSAYTLTFSISMDNNEAFAFSGPKSLAIQLLPLTRRDVEYRLLPISEPRNATEKGQRKGEEGGGRWIWPHCVVIDTGFRETLRLLPAAQGLKSGKRGEIGVWVED